MPWPFARRPMKRARKWNSFRNTKASAGNSTRKHRVSSPNNKNGTTKKRTTTSTKGSKTNGKSTSRASSGSSRMKRRNSNKGNCSRRKRRPRRRKSKPGTRRNKLRRNRYPPWEMSLMPGRRLSLRPTTCSGWRRQWIMSLMSTLGNSKTSDHLNHMLS